MKVLLEAHHPAHVHFWKYPVRELQARGHKVLMIGRDRDVMRRLLKAYDWIPAEIPVRRTRNNRFPVMEMLERQRYVLGKIHAFGPDVVASLMGSYTQTAGLLGIRNIIFTDTETQAFNHAIAHPFAEVIFTPHCYLMNLGHKHRRYNGLHELCYLDPRYFNPDPDRIRYLTGLEPGSYILIRLSAWNTFHDRDRMGIGESIHGFVDKWRAQYRILLSAEEGKTPPGLEPYAVRFEAEDFHHFLGHARFVLTEGASTASEAACMGVPSVFINSVGELGNFVMLEGKYRLLNTFRDPESGIPFANQWLENLEKGPDREYENRYREFIVDHSDTCRFVVDALTA